MPTTRRKATPAARRFALYLRCSTDDQKEGDFTTIDAQREINRRHVAQLGGTVTGEYADEGKTGTNLKRPDFERLLSDARAGKLDAVCVSYMSRLARGGVYHAAEYLLHEAGVQIVMVKEQFTDDMAGYMQKSMTVFMDGMYPEMVKQWTNTKMQEMVKNGYVCGKFPSATARKPRPA